MLCCLIHAEQSLYAITGNTGGFTNSAEKQLGKLKSELEFADIEDIFNSGLHEYIDNFQQRLNEISTHFYDSFFTTEINQIQQ